MHDKLVQYRATEVAQEEQLFNSEMSVTNMQVCHMRQNESAWNNTCKSQLGSVQYCWTATRNLLPNGKDHPGWDLCRHWQCLALVLWAQECIRFHDKWSTWWPGWTDYRHAGTADQANAEWGKSKCPTFSGGRWQIRNSSRKIQGIDNIGFKCNDFCITFSHRFVASSCWIQ